MRLHPSKKIVIACLEVPFGNDLPDFRVRAELRRGGELTRSDNRKNDHTLHRALVGAGRAWAMIPPPTWYLAAGWAR